MRDTKRDSKRGAQRDSKRRCGFCGRMPLNGVNIALIVLICVVVYVSNHFEMKQYRANKAKEQQERQTKQQEKPTPNQLQEECFFQNNRKSCEVLKSYEGH